VKAVRARWWRDAGPAAARRLRDAGLAQQAEMASWLVARTGGDREKREKVKP
jgi:hypothetical protein